MTAALKFPAVQNIAFAIVGLALSFGLFFAAVPLVQAQAVPSSSNGLTSTQKAAIVSLLQSFGANTSVIANVQAALNGGTVPVTNSATLSLMATPAPQTVVPGSTAFTVVNYAAGALGSSEDIRVLGLWVTYMDNMPVDPTNCQAFDGSSVLTTGTHILNPQGGDDKFLSFDHPVVVARGTVKVISLKCTIPSSATSGSFSFGLPDERKIQSFIGVSSGNVVPVKIEAAGFGSLMTVAAGAKGTFYVALDSGTPNFGVVAAGSTGVELGRIRFTGAYEDINLRQVALQLTSGTRADLVNSQVTLWDATTNTQIGTAVFPSGTTAVSSQIDAGKFRIPNNGSRVMVIKGDIAGISTNGPLTASGDTLKVDYDGNNNGTNGNYGTGVSSGVYILPSSPDTLVRGIRIYKSSPTFTYSTSGGILVNGTQSLLTLSVSSDTHGDVTLGKLTFAVAHTGGVTLSNPTFTGPNGSVGSAVLNPNNTITVTFNSTNNTADAVIAAGTTKTYVLRGAITAAGGGSISISLKADTAAAPIGTVAALGSSNIIWSPESTTTFASVTNNDWVNGYGLGGCFATSGLGQDCFSNVMSNSNTVQCPVYNMPICPQGSHVESGGKLPNGCDAAPKCVSLTTTIPDKISIALEASVGNTKSSNGYITVPTGSTVNVAWSAVNANVCTISPQVPGLSAVNVRVVNSFTALIARSTSYTLTCTNTKGTATSSETIRITATSTALVPPVAPTNSLSATPLSGVAPVVVTFKSVTGYPQALGGKSITLDFGDQSPSQSIVCAGNDGVCTTPVITSHTYTAPGTYTATLTENQAIFGFVPKVRGTASIKVSSSAAEKISIALNANVGSIKSSNGSITVPKGSTVNVAWNTVNANVCTISPQVPGLSAVNVRTVNSFTTLIARSISYTLTCSNAKGTATSSETIRITATSTEPTPVVTTNSLSATPTSGVAPLKVTFSAMGIIANMDFGDGTTGEIVNGCIEAVTSCLSKSVHTYSSAGTYTAKMSAVNSTTILSTVTVKVTPSALDKISITLGAGVGNAKSKNGSLDVLKGSTVNISWNAKNATACTISPRVSSLSTKNAGVANNFNATITKSISYTLTCTNAKGASAKETVRINAADKIPVPSNPGGEGGTGDGGGSGPSSYNTNNVMNYMAAVAAAPFDIVTDIVSDIMLITGLY
jgi:PKD repeat protein